MADPLLTTLCTICRVLPPKYVCPRCSTQTCSLACSKKHKAWAECSGMRDPTAFMPVHKLRTAAGVDHDYNFLSAIERERDRNRRSVIEDKGLFTTKELALDDKYKFTKQWFGEHVQFSVNEPRCSRPRHFEDDSGSEEDSERGGENGHGRVIMRKRGAWTRQVRQRLANADIKVVQVPEGMTRQRENMTSWRRKAARINWSVEWFVYDTDGKHTRIRHKALETVPLYKAAGESMAYHRKGQQKEEEDDYDDEAVRSRKRRKVLIHEVNEDEETSAMQDDEANWIMASYPSQNPFTSAWDLDHSPTASSWLADEEIEARRHYRFFLLKAPTPAGKPKELIPLDSAETLSTALQGRTVLEYPTLYILPPSNTLPDGHFLGSPERRKPLSHKKRKHQSNLDKRDASRAKKRQAREQKSRGKAIEGNNPQNSQRAGHKVNGRRVAFTDQSIAFAQRNRPESDAEEGEINSDGEPLVLIPEPAADTSSSEPDTSSDEEENNDPDEAMEDDDDGSPEEVRLTRRLSSPPIVPQKKVGLSLVDYSNSDSDAESDDGDDLDLTTMNPDNPELVASAIKEIVGLLT